MCKMLFIGTNKKLEEIPENKLHPDICLETISGEFLPIADKFKNPYIYFVGTSRGCSCDFGIEQGIDHNKITDDELEARARQRNNLLDSFRKLLGTQEKHIHSRIGNLKKLVEQERHYHDQTMKLIQIIYTNSTDNKTSELYCCWAGEYSAAIEETKTVNLKDMDLKKYFEIELREKVNFIQQ